MAQDVKLLDQLRDLVRNSGRAHTKICGKCKIKDSVLSRFMRGGGLSLATATKVAGELDHKLVLKSADDPGILFFKNRAEVQLERRFAEAQRLVRIVTSWLNPEMRIYAGSIIKAVLNAKNTGRFFRAVVIASDPADKSGLLKLRSKELGETEKQYQENKRILSDAVEQVAATFKGFPECQLRLYDGLTLQLTQQIDGWVFVSTASLRQRASKNCVFGVPMHLAGVKETFEAHFEELEARSKVVKGGR